MRNGLRTAIFVGLTALATPTALFAGGGSYKAEILEFKETKKEQYRMVLLQFENPYGEDPPKPIRRVIHLRFSSRHFRSSRHPLISRKSYLEAIEVLRAQFKKGGSFQFGIIADGYEPIPGKPGEFQSNALVYQEDASKERVVYSYPRDV